MSVAERMQRAADYGGSRQKSTVAAVAPSEATVTAMSNNVESEVYGDDKRQYLDDMKTVSKLIRIWLPEVADAAAAVASSIKHAITATLGILLTFVDNVKQTFELIVEVVGDGVKDNWAVRFVQKVARTIGKSVSDASKLVTDTFNALTSTKEYRKLLVTVAAVTVIPMLRYFCSIRERERAVLQNLETTFKQYVPVIGGLLSTMVGSMVTSLTAVINPVCALMQSAAPTCVKSKETVKFTQSLTSALSNFKACCGFDTILRNMIGFCADRFCLADRSVWHSGDGAKGTAVFGGPNIAFATAAARAVADVYGTDHLRLKPPYNPSIRTTVLDFAQKHRRGVVVVEVSERLKDDDKTGLYNLEEVMSKDRVVTDIGKGTYVDTRGLVIIFLFTEYTSTDMSCNDYAKSQRDLKTKFSEVFPRGAFVGRVRMFCAFPPCE